MAKTRNGKSYGGKNGVWLKSQTPSKDNNIETGDKEFDAYERNLKVPNKTKSVEAEIKSVIGWDDNLGRPTYHLEGSTGIISGSETSTSPYADMDDSFGSLEEKSVDGLHPFDWTSVQKRKGQYGKKGNQLSSKLSLSLDNSDRYNIKCESVYDSLPSKSVSEEIISSIVPKETQVSDTKCRHRKKKKVSDSKDVVVQQISSHTPLNIAKAFFEHLDSTESLTIDSNIHSNRDNSMKKMIMSNLESNENIRTIRVPNIKSRQIIEEYNKYVESTCGCGVVPLDIIEFVNQRGVHFIHEKGIEGILDEIPKE